MSTSRSRNNLAGYIPSWYHQYTKYGSNPAVDHDVPASFSGVAKYIDDEPHPGYKRLRSKGAIVLGNCSIRTETREYTSGSIYLNDPPNMVDFVSGDLAGVVESLIPNRASATSATAEQVCLIKAYAKMNESALLAGEILHDLDQTVSMMRKPMKAASKLVGSLLNAKKRILRKLPGQIIKASSDAWLEYRYGWKPLMMDVDTVVDRFTSQVKKYQGEVLVARSGVTFADSRSGNIGPPILPYGVSTIKGAYSTSDKASYMAGVMYTRSVYDDLQDINALLGTRPRDVPSTAWEVIPFSFVLDWFVNVGDWLQAIVPVPGVNFLRNWTTLTRFTSQSCAGHFEFNGPGSMSVGTYHGTFGSSTRTWKSHTRRRDVELSSYPVLKRIPLSGLHQADAVALSIKPILSGLKSLRH